MEGRGHLLRVVACASLISSYSGMVRPKRSATFWARPSLGQSWAAISKVRAGRVLVLGEDLERFEAIFSDPFHLKAVGRWPFASAFLSARPKKPGPGDHQGIGAVGVRGSRFVERYVEQVAR